MIKVTTIGSYAGSRCFIFQQDSAPVHIACLTQDWLKANYPGFIERISNPKLSRFEPTGLLHLGRHAEKVS